MWWNNFYWTLQAFVLRIKNESSQIPLSTLPWRLTTENVLWKKKCTKSTLLKWCWSYQIPTSHLVSSNAAHLPPASLTAKGPGAGRDLSIWTASMKNSAPVHQTGDLCHVGTQKHYAANTFNTALPTTHWNYISSLKHQTYLSSKEAERGKRIATNALLPKQWV